MRKQKCEFCVGGNKATCSAMSRDGYYCTRAVGHTGNHVACGSSAEDHKLKTWEQVKAKKGETE